LNDIVRADIVAVPTGIALRILPFET